MHYRVDGMNIKTENAAKSELYASAEVNSWIDANCKGKRVVDYGCGKLRYARKIYAKCEKLCLVDSDLQINRVQKLYNKTCSISEYATRYWPRAVVESAEHYSPRPIWNVAICANVLSSIPTLRYRKSAIRNIYDSLTENGIAFFCTQYTNSRYCHRMRSPDLFRAHYDGYISESHGSHCFYGIINRESLTNLVKTSPFEIMSARVSGQSAYLVARRRLTK